MLYYMSSITCHHAATDGPKLKSKLKGTGSNLK
jgi:hypothetical protein